MDLYLHQLWPYFGKIMNLPKTVKVSSSSALAPLFTFPNTLQPTSETVEYQQTGSKTDKGERELLGAEKVIE